MCFYATFGETTVHFFSLSQFASTTLILITRLTISISRRADCVESPFASRDAPKRVSPPPARATGAVGLDAMLGGMVLK